MKRHFSFRFLVGMIAGFFYLLNVLLVSVLILLLFPIAYLIPIPKFQKHCTQWVYHCISLWPDINKIIMNVVTNTKIEVEGLDNLYRTESYLVIANHQSWVDTYVLYQIFNHRIPFLKFLVKQELLWMPVVGQSCWLLGFPFLRRWQKASSGQDSKNQMRDLGAIKEACKKFKATPTSIMTFVEGTRYTVEKAKEQKSLYQHLLKPKAGGIAFVLTTLGDSIRYCLNVTIVYPEAHRSLWDFFCGRMQRIIVKIEKVNIPAEFIGDYEHDLVFRENFQEVLNQWWAKKDELIGHILEISKSRSEKST